MKRSQAIAFLLMAACVALAAAKPTLRPMYDDWLEQQGQAKIAADDSEYGDYPHLEHETVCLKATEFLNCQCATGTGGATCAAGGCCSTVYYETKIACCNGIQTNGNYYYPEDDEPDMTPTPPVVIGSCDTKVHLLADPIAITGGHKKLGTFTKFCTIAHGSLCGAPFCNDLQLVQEGIVMTGLAVAKVDPRPDAPTGYEFDECPTLSNDITSNRTALRGWQVEAMGGAETEGYGYGDSSYGGSPGGGSTPPPPPPTTTWYKGVVEVYSGPVTIYSKKYHFKYHFGHMEYTHWAGNTTTTTTPGKHPVVNPWTYTLKMVKPQGY